MDENGSLYIIWQKYFRFFGKTDEKSLFYKLAIQNRISIKLDKERLQYEISISNDEMKESEKVLMDKVRLHEVLLRKYNLLTGSKYDVRTWALKEYYALCNIPHVVDVTVNGRTIYIYTDMIIINERSIDYKMGKYRIEICTYGNNSGVKIFGTDGYIFHKRGEGYCHPHIRDNGHCCLGNITDGVSKLIETKQYVVLAQLMMQYLQTYNKDHIYIKIEEWSGKVA